MKALSKETITRITSGQIIVSVYSAVKELVENSLDSGASLIQVDLEDYGLDQITVKDDGSGVEENSIPLMVQNHYTSKIGNYDDLDSLITFGFRGEALFALSESVSELQIISRTSNSNIGSSFAFSPGGCLLRSGKTASLPGTTVKALKLFHKTPVRRERYKKSSSLKKTDFRDVERFLVGLSLAYPQIRFVLTSHKATIFQKPICKNFRDAAVSILGKGIVEKLSNINLHCDLNKINVEMWVPQYINERSLFRSTNERSFIFINNRPVEFPKLSRLLKKYLCSGKARCHPISLVKINVPSHDIDANVEPNKKSVFFKQEEFVLGLIETELKRVYVEENNEETPMSDTVTEYQSKKNDSTHSISLEDHNTSITDVFVANNAIKNNGSLKNNSTESNFVIQDYYKPSENRLTDSVNKEGLSRTNLNEAPCKPSTNDKTLDRSVLKVNNVQNSHHDSSLLDIFTDVSQRDLEKDCFSGDTLNHENSISVLNEISERNIDGFNYNEPIPVFKEGGSERKLEDSNEMKVTSFNKTPDKGNYIRNKETNIPALTLDKRSSFEINNTDTINLESSKIIEDQSSAFVSSSKESLIDFKLSTLTSWATGNSVVDKKTGSPVGPVSIAVPIRDNKPQGISLKRPRNTEKYQDYGPFKKRSRSPGDRSLIDLAIPDKCKKTVELRRTVVQVRFSLSKVNKTKPSLVKGDDISFIGKIPSSEIWALEKKGDIYVIEPRRLREIHFYHRLANAQVISAIELDFPMEINDRSHQKALIQLKDDFRISCNGFKVSEDGRYMTHSCKNLISDIGVEDLEEILLTISRNPGVCAAGCRPKKIQKFFEKESLRMLSDCAPGVNLTEIVKLFSSIKDRNNLDEEKCFHSRNVAFKIFDSEEYES